MFLSNKTIKINTSLYVETCDDNQAWFSSGSYKYITWSGFVEMYRMEKGKPWHVGNIKKTSFTILLRNNEINNILK